MSAPSGVLQNARYSFPTRFENAAGTNPEELVAAAHAGCFSMALSGALVKAGLTPESIETQATVTLEKLEVGFTITRVHLDTRAKVPGATKEQLDAAAAGAKAGCPISRLLNATITMSASLLA